MRRGRVFAPEPLERRGARPALASRTLKDAPAHIAGDYPEWLDGTLAQGVRAMTGPREATADGEPSAARPACQTTLEGQTREEILPSAGASRRQRRRRGRRSGCASSLAPMPRNPGIHAEEDFIKGAHRGAGTRARSLRRCSPAAKTRRAGDRPLRPGAGGSKTLALAADDAGARGRLIATDHEQAPAGADP